MAELQIPSDSSLPALVYSGFNISLDHVATLSDHGIALRDAVIAANVPTLHRTKIAGLFLVYHTITRLGFFRQNTVQWPPRQGPAFNTSHWRDVGFNEDVIQILCFLFYLGPIQTDWEFGRGEQMAPSSPFCNYYNTTDPDKRDPSYQHKDEIPLWAFRFTEGWDEEKNYVYDSRDGRSTDKHCR